MTDPLAPVLPDVKMNLVPVNSPVPATVVRNDLCMRGKSASFVRHIEFDVSGTPLAGNFRPGQAFGIIPPGEDERGKPHKVRLFSVASPTRGENGNASVVATTVKRVIDEYNPNLCEGSTKATTGSDGLSAHHLFLGVCSNYLCDLPVGAKVKMTGPNGRRFLLPVNRDDHDYIFIATGTGIAPFRGMIRELFEEPDGPTNRRVAFIMGAPYTSDLLYDAWLRQVADRYANFEYHTAISRESRPDGRPGLYTHHLIAEQMDHFRTLLSSPTTLIYVCGLAGMQFGLYRLLAEHGLAEGYLTIHDEIADVAPIQWTEEQMKRRIKSTARLMLEVY